jgi:hypothetical protein
MIYGNAGDLMFTASAGGLGPSIRWGERARGEEPTEMNHVGVVSKKGYITPPTKLPPEPAEVIESLWKTVEHPWYPAQKPGQEVSIWRYDGITALQEIIVVQRARKFVGSKYGWWKLFTHLADNKIFGGRLVTRRLLSVDSRPICSYTAASAFACAGIRTGAIPARAQSPDTMWDYVNATQTPWFEVGRAVITKEEI